MRHTFTDDLRGAFHRLVIPAKRNRPGPKPEVPDRAFFGGLLYVARTGIPWRDRPAEFGAWDAVYNRFRRWVASGGPRTLFGLRTADPQSAGLRRVLVDSTVIRAHPHAAGARRREKRSGPGGRPGSRPSAGAGAGSGPR